MNSTDKSKQRNSGSYENILQSSVPQWDLVSAQFITTWKLEAAELLQFLSSATFYFEFSNLFDFMEFIDFMVGTIKILSHGFYKRFLLTLFHIQRWWTTPHIESQKKSIGMLIALSFNKTNDEQSKRYFLYSFYILSTGCWALFLHSSNLNFFRIELI